MILVVLANCDISAHFLLSTDVQASFLLYDSQVRVGALRTTYRERGFFLADCCPSDTITLEVITSALWELADVRAGVPQLA